MSEMAGRCGRGPPATPRRVYRSSPPQNGSGASVAETAYCRSGQTDRNSGLRWLVNTGFARARRCPIIEGMVAHVIDPKTGKPMRLRVKATIAKKTYVARSAVRELAAMARLHNGASEHSAQIEGLRRHDAAGSVLAVQDVEPTDLGPAKTRPVSAAQPERVPVTNFVAEAERLRVPLGPSRSQSEAIDTLRRVAADSVDLFGSEQAGAEYLEKSGLDSRGRTGLDLIVEFGLPAVVMRLDEMRFGFAG